MGAVDTAALVAGFTVGLVLDLARRRRHRTLRGTH